MNKDPLLALLGIPNWQLRDNSPVIQSAVNPQFISIIETPTIQATERELLEAIVKACKIRLQEILILTTSVAPFELEKILPPGVIPQFIVLFGENSLKKVNLSPYTHRCVITETASLQQLQGNAVLKKQLWQTLQGGIQK